MYVRAIHDRVWQQGVQAFKNVCWGPDPYGSVGWTTTHKAKGHRFDAGKGTCLGCKFGPWTWRVLEVANQGFSCTLMFLSLSFSLPPPLYKQTNKQTNKCFKNICWVWNANMLDHKTTYTLFFKESPRTWLLAFCFSNLGFALVALLNSPGRRVWKKRGHKRNLTSSGEACVAAFQTQRPKITT